MEVQDKLRMLREVNKMTQSEIAEKLSISTNGYAKIESGGTKIKRGRLGQIAQLYNMDVLELLSVGEKNTVYLINENGDNNNKIGQTDNLATELTTEVKKLQMNLAHREETISFYEMK